MSFQDERMFAAIYANDFSQVKKLVESGANVFKKNIEGLSALHFACMSGNLRIVKFFVSHGLDVNESCSFTCFSLTGNLTRFPLDLAAEFGNFEMIQYLSKHGAVQFNSSIVLELSCNSGDVRMLGFFLDHEAEIDDSALFQAIGDISLRENAFEFVKCLVEHGANVNAKSRVMETPLFYAVRYSSLPIAKYLIEHGANLSFVFPGRKSLLYEAVVFSSVEMISFLISHGADATDPDILIRVIDDGNLDALSLLVSNGANLSSDVLLHAVQQGHEKILAFLLDHCSGIDKSSLLFSAVESGHAEIVKFLFEHGAKISSPDLLFLAVNKGSLEICEILVKNGADINAVDADSHTAADIAVLNGHGDLVSFFQQHDGKSSYYDVFKIFSELVCFKRAQRTYPATDLQKTYLRELYFLRDVPWMPSPKWNALTRGQAVSILAKIPLDHLQQVKAKLKKKISDKWKGRAND